MEALIETVESLPRLTRFGRVTRMEGLLVEVTGAGGAIGLGGHLRIAGAQGQETPCEVVGFRDGRALAMPFGRLEGITLGARATFEDRVDCYPPQPRLARPCHRRLRAIRWTAKERSRKEWSPILCVRPPFRRMRAHGWAASSIWVFAL